MSSSHNPAFTSRRNFLRFGAGAAVTSLLTGCAAPALAAGVTGSEALRLLAGASSSLPPMTTPIRPVLPAPEVPLAVKIGQMLMLGFSGSAVDPSSVIATNIRDQHLGGVVLFGPNIRSPGQLRALTADLRGLAQLPLTISVDQEGGWVSRLSQARGFPATSTAAYLGSLNNPEETRSEAAMMAQTLADGGITLNLAPVVDVAVNPNNPVIAQLGRSFSADPEAVAAQASAFIDAHHEKGLKCTLKHFPGHGSSRGDSHLGFVDVTDSWSDGELTPYRKLLEQGKVDAVMTAHIFNAKLDPELPATLSPAVVTGLLREQLGYTGVVISDDMRMRAIADLYPMDKAFELAILAGVDVIAVASNVTKAGAVADLFIVTVQRMLNEGVIPPERIDQSFQRIMQLKGVA